MGVITISRQYGSDGRTVGNLAAKALGYLYVNKELLVEVARRAEVPVSEVERFDEQPESMAVRMLRRFLAPAYPEAVLGMTVDEWMASGMMPSPAAKGDRVPPALDEDAYVQLTREVMLGLANQGNVVLVGRGSQALLARRTGVLHVRVMAPEAFCVQTVIHRDDLDAEEAVKALRRVNDRRRRYVKRHYGVDATRAEHYHMILNTGKMGVEKAARAVVEVVRNL